MTIEIQNVYTRKVDREYTKKLFQNSAGMTTGANGKPTIAINPADMQDANDYLVMAMTWATQEEIDALSPKEFDALVEKINKLKQSGSGTTSGTPKKV